MGVTGAGGDGSLSKGLSGSELIGSRATIGVSGVTSSISRRTASGWLSAVMAGAGGDGGWKGGVAATGVDSSTTAGVLSESGVMIRGSTPPPVCTSASDVKGTPVPA